MEYYLKIKDDKVIGEFAKIWQNLQNGHYYVHIQHIPDDKPEKQYRAQFFAKLTQLSQHTGHTKEELYEEFKHDCDISTTKHLSIEEWCGVLNQLEWWAFEKIES